MIGIWYVSGKFRHWKPDGSLDWQKMRMEWRDERRWARLIYECGAYPIAPIQMSIIAQGLIADPEFIKRDVELIRRIGGHPRGILMRKSWENDSEGAEAELETAKAANYLVAYAKAGAEAVARYIRATNTLDALPPDELEDALDVAEAERRLAEPTVPLEQVVRELGP